MERPAPLPGGIKLPATGGRERTDADRGVGDRRGQEQLQHRGSPAPRQRGEVGLALASLRNGDGGLLRRASSPPRPAGVRARDPADVSGIHAAVCQGAEEDERDAEAIAKAATRPTMRFVELKSEQQLDMQSVHRARSRLVGERTALINQLRAVLLERGITVAQGRHRLQRYLSRTGR